MKNNIGAFSLTPTKGCYLSNSNKLYNEDSFSLKILGIEPLLVKMLSNILKNVLQQESILFIVGNKKNII